jgi:hypothetical protein
MVTENSVHRDALEIRAAVWAIKPGAIGAPLGQDGSALRAQIKQLFLPSDREDSMRKLSKEEITTSGRAIASDNDVEPRHDTSISPEEGLVLLSTFSQTRNAHVGRAFINLLLALTSGGETRSPP